MCADDDIRTTPARRQIGGRSLLERPIAGTQLASRFMSAFHDITMTSITGNEVSFDQYLGEVCLVVNVASY